MSNLKLKERIESYQNSCDYKLLSKVPLAVNINGRSFSKLTSFLEKPYCPKFAECMLSTTLRLCSDIDGVLFAYQHNDNIVIILRNDQNPDTSPWYDNKIQKICSVTSSIATVHFNDCAIAIDLNLTGDPIFTSQVFAVPTISEAINTIIYHQQNNFHSSIQFACHYELLRSGKDKNSIKEMLSGLSMDEKIDLLKQELEIDFNHFPQSFRRGVGCYKIPKIIDGSVKNKWFLNTELPIFTKDQSFLSNVFKNGADIFRKENF